MESLAINRPFVDGNKRVCNKRVSFAATDVFLRINGYRLRRAPLKIHAEMIQMFESSTFEQAPLEAWLREFCDLA